MQMIHGIKKKLQITYIHKVLVYSNIKAELITYNKKVNKKCIHNFLILQLSHNEKVPGIIESTIIFCHTNLPPPPPKLLFT